MGEPTPRQRENLSPLILHTSLGQVLARSKRDLAIVENATEGERGREKRVHPLFQKENALSKACRRSNGSGRSDRGGGCQCHMDYLRRSTLPTDTACNYTSLACSVHETRGRS